jgi:DNA-binding MarR family transcriptional regulator
MQCIIANLELERLVVRTADPTHGRILKTGLTERGSKVLADAHEIVASVEEIMIEAVGRRDAECLAGALSRYADQLAT